MMLDEKTTGIASLRELLASHCRTDCGAGQTRDAGRWHTAKQAQTWAQLLMRCRELELPRPDFVFKTALDDALRRLQDADVLDLEELAALREFLRSCRRADDFATSLKGLEPFLPDLSATMWREATRFLEDAIEAGGRLQAEEDSPLAQARSDFAAQEKTIRRVAARLLDHPPWSRLAAEGQPVLFDNRVCLLVRALPPGGKARIVAHSRRGTTMYVETTELRRHNRLLSDMGDTLALLEHRRLVEIVETLRAFELPFDNLTGLIARVDRLLAETKALDTLGCDGIGWANDDQDHFCGRLHNLVLLSRLGDQSVALHVDLTRKQPLLVSGPNAGGKTGFLTLIVQHLWARGRGLPVAGDDQACMPWPGDIYFEGGDNQSLDDDTSSYSAHLAALNQALQAGNSDWVLVDELGSKTAPDEGAALGAAWLERVSPKTDWLIISSHNHKIKQWCADQHWQMAALDLDPDTLQPTFVLRPGALGGSHALALAKRTGMDATVVAKAQALYRDWYHGSAQLGDLEELAGHWKEQISLLEERKRILEDEMAALQQQQAAAANEQIQIALQEELDNVLEKMRATGSKKVVRKLAHEASERFARKLNPGLDNHAERSNRFAAGDRVRHNSSGSCGVVERTGNPVIVAFAGGLTMGVPANELSAAPHSTPKVSHRIVVNSDDPEIALDLQGVRDADAEEQLSRAFDRLCGDPGISQIRVTGRHPDRLRILLAPACKRYGREPIIKRLPDSRAAVITVEG